MDPESFPNMCLATSDPYDIGYFSRAMNWLYEDPYYVLTGSKIVSISAFIGVGYGFGGPIIAVPLGLALGWVDHYINDSEVGYITALLTIGAIFIIAIMQ